MPSNQVERGRRPSIHSPRRVPRLRLRRETSGVGGGGAAPRSPAPSPPPWQMAAAACGDCATCPLSGTVKAHDAHVVVASAARLEEVADSKIEAAEDERLAHARALAAAMADVGVKGVKVTASDERTPPLKPLARRLYAWAGAMLVVGLVAWGISNKTSSLVVGLVPSALLLRAAIRRADLENLESADSACEVRIFAKFERSARFRVRYSQMLAFAKALAAIDFKSSGPIQLGAPFEAEPSGDDPAHFIYVCTHKARDARCGRAGPPLVEALGEAAKRRRKDGGPRVAVHGTSHVGGHKYAGCAIAYPSGDWFGHVAKPNSEELLSTVIAAKRWPSKWRGNAFTGEGVETEF